jgi:hypothetical protein
VQDKPTEHRIVEGGEQWLPLAQSETRRLRAAGLIHASKRLLLPDGAEVFVRIEPGHDHIHIKGGGGDIGMDSGVVDVRSIFEANPSTFLAGNLMETAYVATYHAPFTLRDGDPPRLKDRNGVNDGQFAGILKSSGKSFTGQVPVNMQDAKSFRPVTGVTDDGVLYQKKLCAILCPPSMFTGKLRLYVQALYGAHLSAKAGSGHAIPFEFYPDASGRPALRLKNRFFNPKAPGPDHRVHLTTGNGLHLDKTTGKHWMFSFTDGMRAYKMLAPKHVEALRGWLIHPPTDDHPDKNNPLNEEDREHLEAYILSQCLPYGDTTIASPWVTPDSGAVADPWCMGYSWHWNWSGTAAIARVNTTYSQDATNAAMETRTYQVEVNKVGEDLFSVLQLHSADPVQWSVYRTLWTIAEPNWGDFTLVKTTPKNSQVFVGSATFYSFFERDSLINCIVSITSENEIPASVTYTNGATGGPGGTDCYTTGTKPGTRVQVFGTAAQTVAKFNIGSYVTPPLSIGWTQTRWTLEARNKAFGVWGAGTLGGPFGSGYREFGVSDDDGSNYRTESSSDNLVIDRATQAYTFDAASTVGRESEYGQATIVVPFYDSQAVYVQQSVENTKIVDSQTNQHLSGGGGVTYGFLIRSATQNGTDPYRYFYQAQTMGATTAAPHSLVSTTYEVDPLEITFKGEEKLICTAGQLDAKFDNLGVFHNNSEESVSSGFYTLGSTKANPDGVAISNNLISNEGLGGASADAPVLVGWV